MESSFDESAAWIRRSTTDLKAFVEALAERLQQSMPGLVEVERRKDGLFSHHQHLAHLVLHAGDFDFHLQFDGTHIETLRARTVRGVVLKRDILPLGEWLQALLQETAAISSEMQAASQTLHDFLLQ
ncbi:MAG: hypothetical protein U7M05_09285 [Candidatus Igneacidithiobacillus chanchocoensis]